MNLAQLIEATEAHDNQKRNLAEAQLLEARNKSPALFIIACSEEFSHENLSTMLRPKAGILIKYTLLNFAEGIDKLWLAIDQENRTRIKNNILATLAFPNDTIRNVAADLISLICAIELPHNQWPELIPSLTENTGNKDPEIKKSAILALGKLCDQFKARGVNVSRDVVNQILMGIYYGMQEDQTDDIKLIAVKALTDALIFVKELFDNQNVRQEVAKLLFISVNSNNRKVKVSAMQCLIEFVKIYYEFLNEIFSAVWDVTSQLIISNDKEFAILAIEVWNTIANEDKERGGSGDRSNAFQKQSLQVIMNVEGVLIPALLQNLLDGSKYDSHDEGGELNIVSATKSCLISIAEAIKDKYAEYAIKFVTNFLVSQQPIEVRASLITYSTMLDGPSQQVLAPVVTQALPLITTLLINSQNGDIKEAASEALERTAEVFPQVYFQDPLFSQILPGLAAGIDLHPRISSHICKMWHYLGEEINRKQEVFAIDLSEIIDRLIMNSFKDFDSKYYILIDHSLLAVMTLLLCTYREEVKAKYVRALVEQFKKTGGVSGQRRELIQAGLLACLQTLLHKHQFNNQDSVIDEIFSLVGEMFTAYKEVNADGIYVLGALASAMGPAFNSYSEQVWLFVAEGFKKPDQPELFLATLSAIVELAGACPHETQKYLEEIFKLLVSLLDNKNYDKTLKLRIIMAIGDIALGCKELIAPYIESLTRMYEMAMNAAVTIHDQDPEMSEYLEQLRENVLESYVCFFHAVTESPNPTAILKSIPTVMHFLTRTCVEEYNPTVDYMRSSLAFIADAVSTFKNDVAQSVNLQLVESLMGVMRKFPDNQDNQAIFNYAKKILAPGSN